MAGRGGEVTAGILRYSGPYSGDTAKKEERDRGGMIAFTWEDKEGRTGGWQGRRGKDRYRYEL